MKFNWTRIIIGLVLVILNVGLDQVTKQMAIEQIKGYAPKCYWGEFFCLRYAENKGAFLSLGSNMNETLQLILLTVLPVAMLLYLLYITFLSPHISRWQSISLAIILGGGLSNIYDRIQFGKVVDFMIMSVMDLRTGIFNFADVSIMVGIFMFLVFNFWKK